MLRNINFHHRASQKLTKFLNKLTSFKMAAHWKRMLSPSSLLNLSTFKDGWGLFFEEEVFNLTVLFGAIYMWHNFIVGWNLASLAKHVLLAVLFRRIVAGGICTSKKTLQGQTVIITGANVGIGFATAKDMLRRGAHVIMACRSLQKGEEAKRRLLGAGGRLELRHLDLSNLASVRSFAEGIRRDGIKVHVLINNAGVMWCPYTETADGFELQMGTNHLGHFLLTNLLLQQMQHELPARIVNVSSVGHVDGRINFDELMHKRHNYNRHQAYANSKLANLLFTRHLATLLKGTNIEVFAVHPGVVFTQLGRHVFSSKFSDVAASLFLKTPLEGAQSTIFCATEAPQHPLMYFSDCGVGWPSDASLDNATAHKLWDLSAHLVGCPLEGTGRPLEGTDRLLEGTDRPLEGTGPPLEGTGRPLEGTDRPLEGTGRPLEGTDRPLEGTDRPLGISPSHPKGPSTEERETDAKE